jgi:rhodanese-related sulfurtransferase
MEAAEPIITPTELKASLAKGGITLVDVRGADENARARIDGGVLIPLDELVRRSGELSKSDDIVLYCAHGIRSLHGLMALQSLGFKKVRSLQGGISAWDRQIRVGELR